MELKVHSFVEAVSVKLIDLLTVKLISQKRPHTEDKFENDFFLGIRECIQAWADAHPVDRQTNEASNFVKSYNRLLAKNVEFGTSRENNGLQAKPDCK